mgnify:CR=1 FL=1
MRIVNLANFLYWIDVCPINGNLLATGDADNQVKIFDKRVSKTVKNFKDLHPSTTFWFITIDYLYRFCSLCTMESNWRYDRKLFIGYDSKIDRSEN